MDPSALQTSRQLEDLHDVLLGAARAVEAGGVGLEDLEALLEIADAGHHVLGEKEALWPVLREDVEGVRFAVRRLSEEQAGIKEHVQDLRRLCLATAAGDPDARRAFAQAARALGELMEAHRILEEEAILPLAQRLPDEVRRDLDAALRDGLPDAGSLRRLRRRFT